MKRKYFHKLIIFAFIFSQLFSISSVLVSANSEIPTQNDSSANVVSNNPKITVLDDNKNSIPSTEIIESDAVKQEHKLTLSTNSNKYDSLEQIFMHIETKDAKNFHYIADGISVEQPGDGSLKLIATDEFGVIDVFATYSDGKTIKSSIYTYKTENHVYVSDISQDQAWYDCYKEKYDNNQITLQEWQNEYSKLSVNFSKDDVDSIEKIAIQTDNNTRNTTTTINGRWRWELADGTRLPLAQTKIELRYENGLLSPKIATTYTDNDGYFSFSISDFEDLYSDNSGVNIFLRCFSSSYTFEVSQDWLVLNNHTDTDMINNVVAGTTTTINKYVIYNASNNVTKRFYVQQGMVLAQRFAYEMGFNTDNFIRVAYPGLGQNMSDSGFCWGTVLDNSFCAIGKDRFNDFDTIIHEYAHFVQASKGIYGHKLIDMVLDGPDHNLPDDNFTEKDDKEYAMSLTWSESWATAFSQIAQEFFKSSYPGVPGLADISDKAINPNNDPNKYTYETFTKEYRSCEAQELAVIAFLWDIYDFTNESYDNFSTGPHDWWNCTTEAGTYTLTDFFNVIKTYYPSCVKMVAELMSAHQISAGNVTVSMSSNISSVAQPIVSWSINGSQDHPNNRFKVVFYDSEKNVIVKSPEIATNLSYTDTFNYTVSQSLWNQVLGNKCEKFTIYVSIESWRNDIPSGPYLSKFIPIEIDMSTYIHFYSNTRYMEHSFELSTGQLHEFTITTAKSFQILIQTFGTKDTIMKLYDASNNLLMQDDDSGYSLNSLTTYTFAPNTEYRLTIKFYSASATGKTKLTMTPIAYTVNAYEEFSETSYNGSYSGAMNGNNARCFIFRNSPQITATITISSDFDSFLYVIDPRSPEPTTTDPSGDSVYNDNGAGNRQAAITKSFAAGVPYFIIVTALLPNNNLTGYFAVLFT